MKKILTAVISLMLVFNVVGCKQQTQKQQKKEEKEKFDINIATNILETYMGYLNTGDMESAKKLLSDKVTKKGVNSYNTDLKILGYKTDEVNEVGRSGMFRVKVARSVSGKPTALLDNYSIKVEMEKKDYKITEINVKPEKEAFAEGIGIRMKDKTNAKTNLIIDSSGIPGYTYPKDDNAKINKAPVPKGNFGIAVFNYSGERLAITTHDGDSYIGVVKIDETQASQGGGGGAGGGGGGGGGGAGAGSTGGGSVTIVKEPPIGKDITSMDLIKDSTIDMLSFSQEEKHLVVQYKLKNGSTTLRLYDVDSGDLADFDFQKKYPPENVDVMFSSFDKDALNFEVKEKAATGKEHTELLGKWQLSLKDYKVKRL